MTILAKIYLVITQKFGMVCMRTTMIFEQLQHYKAAYNSCPYFPEWNGLEQNGTQP